MEKPVEINAFQYFFFEILLPVIWRCAVDLNLEISLSRSFACLVFLPCTRARHFLQLRYPPHQTRIVK